MFTYDEQTIVAGSILKNHKGKYQGVVAITDSNAAWLTEPAVTPEQVDMHSRKNLVTENEVQFKKYELVSESTLRGGEQNE